MTTLYHLRRGRRKTNAVVAWAGMADGAPPSLLRPPHCCQTSHNTSRQQGWLVGTLCFSVVCHRGGGQTITTVSCPEQTRKKGGGSQNQPRTWEVYFRNICTGIFCLHQNHLWSTLYKECLPWCLKCGSPSKAPIAAFSPGAGLAAAPAQGPSSPCCDPVLLKSWWVEGPEVKYQH